MMCIFKKLLAVLFALLLTACGSGGGSDPATNGSDDQAADEETVPVVEETVPVVEETVPTVPSGFIAVSESSTSIKLSWKDNAENESSYLVELSLDNGISFTEIKSLVADSTSYSATGLSPSTAYTFRVYATNNTGDSGYSNTASTTTSAPPITRPADPTGLSATVISSATIDLSWVDNASDENNYVVQYSINSGSSFSNIAVLNANIDNYTVNNLAAVTSYTFRVLATNTAGAAYSNVITATTDVLAIPLPLSPTGLIDTGSTSYSVSLSWSDNANNEDQYVVEYKLDDGRVTTLWNSVPLPANTANYTVVGLSELTTYLFRVYAKNNIGNSESSAYLSVATGAVPPPPPPTAPGSDFNLKAISISSSSITISWNGATNITSYGVDGRLSLSSAWTTVASNLNSKTTSYTRSGLPPSTTFYVRVYATNSVGTTYSNTISARTEATTVSVPAAPTGLAASTVSDVSINLSWTDVATNEGSYEVRLSSNGGVSYSLLETLMANSTSFSVAGLSPSTSYKFKVRAKNSAGYSGYSNIASAQTQAPAIPRPDAPSGLAANAISTSEIILFWTDNSDNETNFEVQYSTDGNTFFPTSLLVAENANSDTIEGGVPSTTYYFRVRAVNSTGYSAFTNIASATTQTGTPPILRIINDLDNRVLNGNDWGKFNPIIRVRIGPSENSVVTDGENFYEKLAPFETVSDLYGEIPSIKPGFQSNANYQDFDLSGIAPDYSVFIQTGYWDMELNTITYEFFRWLKQPSRVVACDGVTEAYKWGTYTVTGHTAGVQEVRASYMVPGGHWVGTSFCN